MKNEKIEETVPEDERVQIIAIRKLDRLETTKYCAPGSN